MLKELEELKLTDLFKSLEEERSNFIELLGQLKNEKLKVDDLGNQLLNIKVERYQKDLDNRMFCTIILYFSNRKMFSVNNFDYFLVKKNSPEPNESNYEIDELKKKNEQVLCFIYPYIKLSCSEKYLFYNYHKF